MMICADPIAPSQDEQTPFVDDLAFGAERLHYRSDAAWAVVGFPSGAIVDCGPLGLLMRLAETDARRIADAMTEAADTARRRKSH